ncbi:CapA family protein [Nocardioides sp. MH1]|uniref:CapA family protein n=1 Tax=Nocardioides sp. MH1 TaxID=3242490 RepID=UPI0035205419
MTTTLRRSSTLVVAALLAAACAGPRPTPARAPDPAPSAASVASDPAPRAAVPVSASSDLLFVGDTFWGRFVEQEARRSGLGARYPFSGLRGFERDHYDAWIGNLECPVVAGLHLPAAEQDRLLSFNCDPGFLDEAARWFTAFSLGNNHTGNQGRDGLAETRHHLDEHGIQHFGDPDPRRLDHVCNVVTVPVRVTVDDGSTTSGGLPLALCGFDGVFRIPSEAAVDELATYAELLPTVAMPHNGLEYTSTPDSIKVSFDRSLIDHGADLVVGGHPHWIQPAEVWHGRLIAYSLGNFIFDQRFDAEVTRSAALQVSLSTDDEDLARWLALGALCRARQGDCLRQVRQAGLPKPRLDYRYSIVGTTSADGVTRPADAAQTRAIEQRLDWPTVAERLDRP